jgi:MGT family glycosyltransferase
MKIGFICPTVPGHLNPMTALARHLQARNHEVVFLYSSSAIGLPYVFRTIVAGAARHKGTQLVLSIGDQLDPKQIGSVPSNAIIVNQTPQLEVLKRTSVCITHAGLNTVLESLAQGVPQVAIPITFEQPGVATRIAAKKTGVTMPFAKLTSDHLSTLLGEVLNNAVYRDNARKFQDIISKTNGLDMAADIVERAFGITKKSASITLQKSTAVEAARV